MARHKAMRAEEPEAVPAAIPYDLRHREEADAKALEGHGPEHARNQREIGDPKRLEEMLKYSIKEDDPELARQAIIHAAGVWVLTPIKSRKRDADAVKFLAKQLYFNGMYWGNIDPRRALRRSVVDSFLEEHQFSATSARTYKAILYAAGRVLYPGEYPQAQAVFAPRAKPTPPAPEELVNQLYSIAPTLPPIHRQRLIMILDLGWHAGLRSTEMLDARGSDVSRIRVGNREYVKLRIFRKGQPERVVPVTNLEAKRRLLKRKAEVGDGFLLRTQDGLRPQKGAVSNCFSQLKEYGYPSTTAEALRAGWAMRLAQSPIPLVIVSELCGKSLFRAYASRVDAVAQHTLPEIVEALVEGGL